jgi:hypothetical protein
VCLPRVSSSRSSRPKYSSHFFSLTHKTRTTFFLPHTFLHPSNPKTVTGETRRSFTDHHRSC